MCFTQLLCLNVLLGFKFHRYKVPLELKLMIVLMFYLFTVHSPLRIENKLFSEKIEQYINIPCCTGTDHGVPVLSARTREISNLFYSNNIVHVVLVLI
jgi:hypothetical protein